MQYSPKLKIAMEEIKAILKKNDIAGFVVIHTPGFSEYFTEISPSYSCAKFEGNSLRFRVKTAEVGQKKAKELLSNTVNMITHLSTITGKNAISFMDADEMFRSKFEVTDLGEEDTSHTQQNN